MVTILALGAALLYGSADFLGGVATKHARVLSMLPLSASAGAVVVVVAAVASAQPARLSGLAWGIAGGAVGGVGLIIFYAGLAAGPMSVVAPVSALMSTVLPVAVALAGGEHASATVYAGALLCLAAIVLVSSSGPADGGGPATGPSANDVGQRTEKPSHVGRRKPLLHLVRRNFRLRAVGYGLGAGTAFGLFFLFLRNGGHSGTLWPVATARLAGLTVVLVAASATRTRPLLRGASTRLLLATAGSGVLDATANICYVAATRAGLFGLAVVLTSLYPGITVLLAKLTLGERLRGTQQFGLLLAAIGVVLVTV
jgi:drug/metabolite transporter (DMT)-like permease